MPSKEYVETTLVERPQLIERVYASGRVVHRSFVYFDGEQKLETFQGLTRTEAKRKHRDRQQAADQGKRPAAALLLADVMTQCFAYLDELAARNEGSHGTVDNYRAAWRKRIAPHPIGKAKLDQLDRAFCLRFLRDLRKLPVASSTQNGTVSALRTVLRYARDCNYMQTDPFNGIPRKEFPPQKAKPGFVPRVLDNDEGTRLLDAARSEAFVKQTDTLFTNIVIVNRATGQRAAETCGLRWQDVDFTDDRLAVQGQLRYGSKTTDPVTITPPKNGENGIRAPRMFTVTRDALYAQLEHELSKGLGRPGDLVFTDATGRPIVTRRLRAAVRRAAKLAGLGDVTPKVLRRSFATAAVHAGISSVEAATMTGHTAAVLERFYAKPIRTAEQERENQDKMTAYGFAT